MNNHKGKYTFYNFSLPTGVKNIIYNSIIVVLKLKAFQNKILWQIFGPKRDENEEWRDNKGLHSLYRLPNIVKVGSCHHGMARPLGCGWGSRPPDMEVSCEYIE